MKFNVSNVLIQMHKTKFNGTLIDNGWVENLKYDNGKTNLNACIILSEIIYWYRPKEDRDSAGKTVLIKKFKGDMLQKSYADLGERFGLSKRQAQEACLYLKKKNLIHIDYRTIEYLDKKTGKKKKANNVTYIVPILENILKITGANRVIEEEIIIVDQIKNTSEDIRQTNTPDPIALKCDRGIALECDRGIALECDTNTKNINTKNTYTKNTHSFFPTKTNERMNENKKINIKVPTIKELKDLYGKDQYIQVVADNEERATCKRGSIGFRKYIWTILEDKKNNVESQEDIDYIRGTQDAERILDENLINNINWTTPILKYKYNEVDKPQEDELVELNGKMIPADLKFLYELLDKHEQEGTTDQMGYNLIKEEIEKRESK